MAKRRYLLAIDQGTTGTHVLVVDDRLEVVGEAYREFTQHFPRPGWVEHDLKEIWKTVERCCKKGLADAEIRPDMVTAIGITNQRETTAVWHRETGEPLAPAIVWQDRRTADVCRALAEDRHAVALVTRTGLLLDPYFSATKLAWVLENVDGARAAAEAARADSDAGRAAAEVALAEAKGTRTASDAALADAQAGRAAAEAELAELRGARAAAEAALADAEAGRAAAEAELAELRAQIDEAPAPAPGARAFEEHSHNLFIPVGDAYELATRPGAAPARGERVELDGATYRVVRVGPSPLPGATCACAYLELA
jgi:hypothetical protein